MCVKIITPMEELSYDTSKPLESQLTNSSKVVINYDPQDTSIEKFLSEIERFSRTGINCSFNLQVNHNNHVRGAKTIKTLDILKYDITMNELIHLMVLSYSNVDKKLEELSNFCLDKV